MAIGTTVGRYRIEGLLGAGGMGAVYRALDPQLGRPVALKLLHQSGDGSIAHAGQQRLIREAQAMARVTHPNLVMVFEVGNHDGQVYVAMEYVEGGTLRQWLDAEPRSVAAVLQVFAEAAQGLHAAHLAGLVHRDFKPANVMVSRTGRVQVTDFGLARATELVDAVGPTGIDDALAVHLTQTGAMMGTPAYMAPEQFEGAATDSRTDQFAFCVALFEALYGRRPFLGDTSIALMTAVLAGQITAPPVRADVPRRVQDALVRGLARAPEQRFASLPELLAALNLVHPSPSSQAGRPHQRAGSSTLVVVCATAVALAAIVATPFVWAALRSPPELPAAGAGPGSAIDRGEGRSAGGILGPDSATSIEPTVGLETLAKHYAITGFKSSVTRWSAAKQDFARACAQVDAPARWCAAEPFAGGMVLLLGDDYAGGRREFDAAIALDPTWAAPHVARSATLLQLGEIDGALAAAVEARRLDSQWAAPLRAAAEVHLANDDRDQAGAELRLALEIAPELPELHAELALVYHAQGLDSEAERYAKQALVLDEDNLSALVLLAERALEDHRNGQALELATRASAAHPSSIPAWLARADALALLGKPKQARAAYAKALELAALSPENGADPSRLEATRQALAAGLLPTPALGGPGKSKRSSSSKSKPGGRSDQARRPTEDSLDGL